jgi:uncharacterized protein with ParB-like and HNH nuclease domain
MILIGSLQTPGKFYCVQNITLIPQEEYFNIVDGQQRLATMVLILSSLDEKDLVRNKVRFPKNSIREKTNEFINEFITNGDFDLVNNFSGWDLFIGKYPEFDHQDKNQWLQKIIIISLFCLFMLHYLTSRYLKVLYVKDEVEKWR